MWEKTYSWGEFGSYSCSASYCATFKLSQKAEARILRHKTQTKFHANLNFPNIFFSTYFCLSRFCSTCDFDKFLIRFLSSPPQYILRSHNNFVIVYICSNIGFSHERERKKEIKNATDVRWGKCSYINYTNLYKKGKCFWSIFVRNFKWKFHVCLKPFLSFALNLEFFFL